jgi:regulator of protease activity HflC (stomatin/prohibitin superfamily)
MDPTAILASVAVLGVGALLTSLRILWEYERGVIFRLGNLTRAKGPGLIFLVPFGVERMRRMDLRIVALDIPPQDTITKDNVSLSVNAVVYFRVGDPAKAVVEIEDYYFATSQLAQTTLRSVIGQSELDELLAHREQINNVVRKIIDEGTDPWGIEVTGVEIKDIDLPKEMKRAMAKQAEAERERRGKVIAAEGEYQASKKLALAAAVIERHPGGRPTPIHADRSGDRRRKQLHHGFPHPHRSVRDRAAKTGLSPGGRVETEVDDELDALSAGEEDLGLAAGTRERLLAETARSILGLNTGEETVPVRSPAAGPAGRTESDRNLTQPMVQLGTGASSPVSLQRGRGVPGRPHFRARQEVETILFRARPGVAVVGFSPLKRTRCRFRRVDPLERRGCSKSAFRARQGVKDPTLRARQGVENPPRAALKTA